MAELSLKKNNIRLSISATSISIPVQPPYVCWISVLPIPFFFFLLLFHPQEWYMARKLRNLCVQKIFNLYLNDKGKQVLFHVLGYF